MARSFGLFVLGCMAFVGSSCSENASINFSKGNPKAALTTTYTTERFVSDFLSFNRRTMVDAYQQSGNRNPEWDELATRFLEAHAIRFSNSISTRVQVEATVSDEDRVKLGQQLEELGCADPLVIYCRSQDLVQDDPGKCLQLAHEAFRGLRSSSYPYFRKLAAARWLWTQQKASPIHTPSEIRNYGPTIQATVEVAVELLHKEQLPESDNRFIYETLFSHLPDVLVDRYRQQLIEKAEGPKLQRPWLLEMFAGQHHIKLAWGSRGGSWASNVTTEGWQGFRRHLGEASKYLVAAWNRSPRLPHAAALMIIVSGGGGGGDERHWFDRAITTQFDYIPAYSRLAHYLRPRWGGSLDAMYKLATDCLDSNRFETDVPDQYFAIMRRIARDDSYDYWMRPGVYEDFVRYCQGYASSNFETPQWWKSLNASFAYRVRRFDDARRILEELGEQFDVRAWDKFDCGRNIPRAQIYARTGKAKTHLGTADQHWQRQEFEQSDQVIQQAIALLTDDDPGLPYLHHYRQLLRWKIQDSQGSDWIDLFDGENLAGWKVVSGEWEVDDKGRILGHSRPEGMLLECLHTFGNRVEMKGSLTFLEGTIDPKLANAGIILSWQPMRDGTYRHRELLFHGPVRELHYTQNFKHEVMFPGTMYDMDVMKGNTIEFHIKQWDKQLRINVDGTEFVKHYGMKTELPKSIHPFAIGGHVWLNGLTVRFNQLQVRRLAKRP